MSQVLLRYTEQIISATNIAILGENCSELVLQGQLTNADWQCTAHQAEPQQFCWAAALVQSYQPKMQCFEKDPACRLHDKFMPGLSC